MFAPEVRETRSDDDSPAIGIYPVVFPLPGGRSVAASAWIAVPVEKRAGAGDGGATTSSAPRRRAVARRLSLVKLPAGYGEPAVLPPEQALQEPRPT